MATPKRIPAFQMYAHAWLGSMHVDMMPAEVEGTYIRLLCKLWVALTQGEGQILPVDPKQIRTLTKLSEAQWRKAWPLLEKHFPMTDDNAGRVNPTLLAVWTEREAFVLKQRANGEGGGRPPKNPNPPKTKPKPEPRAKPRETQAFPEKNPSPNPDETSVSGTGTALPPTAADAAVSPPAAAPDEPPEFAERKAALRAQFTDERSVLAFDRHCRASRNPEGFLLDVEYAAKPRPSDGAEGVPWDVIGLAMHELSAKGMPATEHLIRKFAAPIMAPAAAPGAGEMTAEQAEAAMLRRIHAGEFAYD